MQKLYYGCTGLKNHVADSNSIKMSQGVDMQGTYKGNTKMFGKLWELVKSKETKSPTSTWRPKHLSFG